MRARSQNKKCLVLGIMSGTSIDGVDYALCEISAGNVRLVDHWSADFPPSMRDALHSAARGHLPSYALAQLHHDLGRFYAARARAGRIKGLLAAGLHGQTVFHNPPPAAPATLQLGEPAYLAETLRRPVISNFRAADMAAGGQGAPLATIFHQTVFARRGRHICVNNLGGISNVTSLDWRRGSAPRVLAFDTGPANVLIDMLVRQLTGGKKSMDRGGRLAASGRPDDTLLKQWLAHPYFKTPPPKSTGRELFGEPFFQSILPRLRRLTPADQAATLLAFTARSLAVNYRLHLPPKIDEIILTGGGAVNPAMVRAITEQFPEVKRVVSCLQLGWPPQTIEPAAFALLAWLRLHEIPGNLPRTTGARRPVLSGQITSH